jgi:peptide chain release factor 3
MWDTAEYALARWISSDDPKALATFLAANTFNIADDVDGHPVFLAANQFRLDYTRERAAGIVFTDIKDRNVAKAKAG